MSYSAIDAKSLQRQVVNGIEHRRYDNRVTIIGADLAEIDLDKYGR